MFENRFGLFIHWGIYALTGFQEQAQARAGISHGDYEALMHRFNPVAYDPDAWVRMAKDAGMEYICFTAKHHDGFCMWDTETTDYCVTHTPYGRDVLAMLSESCRKYGMRLSIYYSNPDWYQPFAYNPLSSHQWCAKDPESADRAAYLDYIRAQLRELLTNYGPVYTFFWDIPPMFTEPSLHTLIRQLQPGILINDRGYDKGDFATPERTVPEGSRFPTPTEACQSLGQESWGYRESEDYYPARVLMSAVDKIMAMGGSYLLNVGPDARGNIPAKAQVLLHRIGGWYRRMEGCLQNTVPASESFTLSVSDPYIALEKDGKTYLHFWQGLSSTAVTFLQPPKRKLLGARCMNSGKSAAVRCVPLPSRLDEDCVARVPYTSLWDIPVDAYPDEPVVLELTFGEENAVHTAE